MRCFLFIIWTFIGLAAKGQVINTYDSIYDFVEVMPKYPKGDLAILQTEVIPIFQKYANEKNTDITAYCSLHAILIIDRKGRIAEVNLLHSRLPENCKKELIARLKKVVGWSPGYMYGKPVCCRHSLMCSCIKW